MGYLIDDTPVDAAVDASKKIDNFIRSTVRKVNDRITFINRQVERVGVAEIATKFGDNAAKMSAIYEAMRDLVEAATGVRPDKYATA